jgi:hypothetical protein
MELSEVNLFFMACSSNGIYKLISNIDKLYGYLKNVRYIISAVPPDYIVMITH